MSFKKISAIVAAFTFGLAFVACDSDSSSGPQSDPEPTSSQEESPASSSDISEPLSSSATSPASSATLPASSATKECYKDGMADITVRNMERKSISCPNSKTIYDYDLQIFYKCVGDALIETDMAPCVSDVPESSSSAVTPKSSGGETGVSSSGTSAEYGTLLDSRDGKSYKTVVIGGKTWMAENLNFATDSSFCYDDTPANCTKYGRLYQESDAVKACPEGWRIPTADDWMELRNTAEFEWSNDLRSILEDEETWEINPMIDPVPMNLIGFAARAGGYRAKTGQYDGEGTKAYFWGESNMNYYAWILSKQYELDKESIMRGYFAYSVRCVQAN